jgi:glutaredoxin
MAADVGRAAPQVILYYADWCGYCRKAKGHLERRGVEYELRDVDIPANQAELVAKSGGRSIPVIDVDGRILKGYSAERLDELLDGAS